MDYLSIIKYAAAFSLGGITAVVLIIWYLARIVNKTVEKWNDNPRRPRITITPQKRHDEDDWR